ncbi:MAG TPA: vitamin K epoxide reductase family protein [Mycobacteriales bacterium]|nr:vitamin K epoxide reductase family protein [Mycobacteriales bacterium]
MAYRGDRTRLAVPGWLPVVSLLLCVVGLGVASYLTYEHFDTHATFGFCPESSGINCQKVTTSPESRFLGMPVAVLGLAFFVAAPVLLVPAAWRSPSRWIRGARMLAVSGGMAFVVWLLYAEFFRIHAICLYCTAVHVLTLLLFATVVIGTAVTAPYDADEHDFEDELDEDEDEDELGAAAPPAGQPSRLSRSSHRL